MRCIRGVWRRMAVFGVVGLIVLGQSGCQPQAVEEESFGPVFYPAPPNRPRMQFLRSYSGAEDFSSSGPGFLEVFVLGEEEGGPETISKPYGAAIHDGKIYVCDVGRNQIHVMDVRNNTYDYFRLGRPLRNPANIFIEPNGTKYVVDATGGAIYVYNKSDKLTAILGSELGMSPRDVVVRGNEIFVTDDEGDQVLVLDKSSGKLLRKMGQKVTDMANWSPSEFSFISDLDVDKEGNVYVSDKLKSTVTKFDKSGEFASMYGGLGNQPGHLVRPKGVAIDRENRVWVADAGPATAVKVYRNDGRLLMYFGTLGKNPGQMYMPAGVVIDYDNVDLFRKYAVEGAELEFLILVTNQFGPRKVNVYGFGIFPESAAEITGLDAEVETE